MNATMVNERQARMRRTVLHRSVVRLVLAFGALMAGVVLALPALAGNALLMIEEETCPWCQRWDEEIGVVYHKTEEAKRAPLRRADIDAPLPEGITLKSPARFTPTFVLLHDGVEVDRIEGYPGEEFFWGLLNEMLDRLPARAPTQEGLS